MIGNAVVEIEPAKPTKSQMQFDFLAQPPLKADAIAVAHDQHPDHKLWINRRPADLAVIGLQLLAHIAQHQRHEHIDASEQVVLRDAVIKPELIEEAVLIAALSTHHRRLRGHHPEHQRNHCSQRFSRLFRQHRPRADLSKGFVMKRQLNLGSRRFV